MGGEDFQYGNFGAGICIGGIFREGVIYVPVLSSLPRLWVGGCGGGEEGEWGKVVGGCGGGKDRGWGKSGGE